ncbi:MAG: hypothetical protein A3G18_00235 [Rhodospirillales bacterium RIFCSPLOWO2_12_FULL_58_28]|nr:MAG: hypothetical protein A3H92_02845 [Rhodospirillales bacterium RIFCSPLOWO2_02_FULL_58_16]OHC79896.1 MAG: hypothetical protein A3G18_00235 [Rhodospirillales bacterium RIFCSPLOWO2_12_FULL_58_28]
MNKKTLVIFLIAFALGGAASSYLLGLLTAGGDKPSAETAKSKPAGRPDWMAPEEAVKALDLAARPKAMGAPASAPEERERSLKVGVIGPESGDEAAYGLAVVDGVMMAAERFNAGGGLGGKKFEVLHFDNKGGDALTREIFNNLVGQGAIAVFAAPTGWSTFAATHLANSSGTILMSVGSRRQIGRSGDYVFQYSLSENIAVDDLMKFAAGELGYKIYAVVTSSAYDYSLDLSSHFKRTISAQGGAIAVETDTYDTFTGENNISAVVQVLKNNPTMPQAVIYTGGAKEGAVIAQAIAEAGLKLPIIGGEDLFNDGFLKGGEAVRGSLVYATFSPDNGAPETAEFMKSHAEKNSGAPDRFTALAYDAFNVVADSVKAADSLKSSKVKKALLGGKESHGVTGATGWDADGVAVKHPFIYRVEAGKGGEKFVPVKR